MAAKRGEFGPEMPYYRQTRRDFYAIPLAENSYGSVPPKGIVTPVSNKPYDSTEMPFSFIEIEVER